MTLRKLLKDLLGTDGDTKSDLDREVAVRIVRRRADGVGGIAAEKYVSISRVSIFRGDGFTPAVDIVIEQDELEAAKEVLR